MTDSISPLAPLFTLLHQYQSLTHLDQATEQQLAKIQSWQKQRLAYSHQTLFSPPTHQAMAQFFLNRLYGNNETASQLASQIEKVLRYAQKIEKLVPNTTINTAIVSIQIALNALLLDIQIARYFAENQIPDVNEQNIIAAYQQLNQREPRLALLDSLELFGEDIDKYARSFLVLSAFKLAKNSAYKHGMQYLYDFIGEGFTATKPLKSAATFLKQFTQVERQIIEAVHQNQPHPFGEFSLQP